MIRVLQKLEDDQSATFKYMKESKKWKLRVPLPFEDDPNSVEGPSLALHSLSA